MRPSADGATGALPLPTGNEVLPSAVLA